LRERYEDDPSTHPDFDPDLWTEVGSFGGPDKNRVYGLSNTTTDNLRAAHNVSTFGSSQSVSSTQSEAIVALKQHTTHLTEKYEQLSANYEQHIAHLTKKYKQLSANYKELRQMVMNITSQKDDTCVPPFFGCMVSGTTNLLLQLLQLRHCSSLIFFWKHIKFVMNII